MKSSNSLYSAGAPYFLAFGLAVGTLVSSSAAAVTSYNRATFQAALAGGTVFSQNFDSLSVDSLLATVNDVTYGASLGTPIVTNAYLTSTSPNGLGSTSVGFFQVNESATFTFANEITAFAIDINTFAISNDSYQATLNIGDVVASQFEVFPGTGTGQFLGFISDTAFTSVTVSTNSTFAYTLDTLVYGEAQRIIDVGNNVPDGGSTWFMVLLSLIGMRAFSRRNQQS